MNNPNKLIDIKLRFRQQTVDRIKDLSAETDQSNLTTVTSQCIAIAHFLYYQAKNGAKIEIHKPDGVVSEITFDNMEDIHEHS